MANTSDDDRCDLDPNKICDNCFRCLEIPADQDYAKIEIAAVYTGEDYIVEDGVYDDMPCTRIKKAVHAHTLNGLKAKRRI